MWQIHKYIFPGRPSTQSGVKSENIMEKHSKIEWKKMIIQILVKFWPPNDYFWIRNDFGGHFLGEFSCIQLTQLYFPQQLWAYLNTLTGPLYSTSILHGAGMKSHFPMEDTLYKSGRSSFRESLKFQIKALHCKPIPVMKAGFCLWGNSHREKPVFITGNPVLITGMGLQCCDLWTKGSKIE